MNIPITSRVKRAGHQGCGCGCESAAKMWGAAKVAYGEKSSPNKMCSKKH